MKKYKIMYKGKKIDVSEGKNKLEALKAVIKKSNIKAVQIKLNGKRTTSDYWLAKSPTSNIRADNRSDYIDYIYNIKMKKEYKTTEGNRKNALSYYYKHKKDIRDKANAFRADPKNKEFIKERDKRYRELPANKLYQQEYHKK